MEEVAVGVDIGGTTIRAGLVNRDGKVLGRSYSIPTGGNDTAEIIIERIRGAISFILQDHEQDYGRVSGIGMGVTGPLDIRKGLVLECPQLPTLHYFPLKESIGNFFNLPVWMNNDANAMILGESLWGSGKGYHDVLGFTLGTGIGCAMVSNREILRGSRGLAGEIWPSPYKDVTIEDYVSGSGISSLYRKISGEIKSSFEIGELGDRGDKNALKVWNTFGNALGFALSWTINLIDPDIVILGGSISNSFHLFERFMIPVIKKYGCPSPEGMPSVVKCTLGDDAGFIGGAGLVFTKSN